MMKKVYEIPITEVIQVEFKQLMAGSAVMETPPAFLEDLQIEIILDEPIMIL